MEAREAVAAVQARDVGGHCRHPERGYLDVQCVRTAPGFWLEQQR